VPPITTDLPMRVRRITIRTPSALSWTRMSSCADPSHGRFQLAPGGRETARPGPYLDSLRQRLHRGADASWRWEWQPNAPEAVETIDLPDGPKGNHEPLRSPSKALQLHHENAVTGMKVYGKQEYYTRTSMWVPGVLLVEHCRLPLGAVRVLRAGG